MANKIWKGTTTAYATAGNWWSGAAPSASDTVWFNTQAAGDVAGSDQSGTALTAFHANMDFTYAMGDNGTPLQITSPLVYIGEASNSGISGSGSGRINLAPLGACTVYVFNSASTPTDSGKEPIRLKPNNSSTEIIVAGGLVGIASDNIGDTATLGTLNVTGGTAHVTSGTTVTTVQVSAGEADLYAPATTVNISAGVLNTRGDFTIGTLSVYGGTVYLAHRKVSAGNEVATLNLYNATIDVSDTPDDFVVGTLNYWGSCRVIANAAKRSHFQATLGTQAGTLTLDAA